MNSVTALGLAAAFCTTASFLPQALKTIKTKGTSGISLSMYSLFALGTVLCFFYGLFTGNSPIYIANGITLIFTIIILGFKIRFK